MDHHDVCMEKRDIKPPDCKEKNPDDCNRTFYIYLPSIVCDGRRTAQRRELQSSNNDAPDESSSTPASPFQSNEPIGTLPLIFAIHCFGCTPHSIADSFATHANTHNAVLVLPQGLQNSFNARHCCGYALENDVDDVGFMKYIQTTLSEEYDFVDKEYSYGVGWSNGGMYFFFEGVYFSSVHDLFEFDIPYFISLLYIYMLQ